MQGFGFGIWDYSVVGGAKVFDRGDFRIVGMPVRLDSPCLLTRIPQFKIENLNFTIV
jgi:hypothetical protein